MLCYGSVSVHKYTPNKLTLQTRHTHLPPSSGPQTEHQLASESELASAQYELAFPTRVFPIRVPLTTLPRLLNTTAISPPPQVTTQLPTRSPVHPLAITVRIASASHQFPPQLHDIAEHLQCRAGWAGQRQCHSGTAVGLRPGFGPPDVAICQRCSTGCNCHGSAGGWRATRQSCPPEL